ncbi:MAG TPA: CHAT domain-containing protein, partial [Chloroflexia bacterium]
TLQNGIADALRARAKLRVRLRLSEAPELAILPWEYLYDPVVNRFFALDQNTALVRYLDLPEPVEKVKVRLPLRVLVVISSPDDHLELDVTQEWANLNTALKNLIEEGLVSLDKLEDATLPALLGRLNETSYHILHFIGHGGFDRVSQEGVLVMEDKVGRSSLVSGQQLGWILHNHDTLSMVILNACEGAVADDVDIFSGTAQSLVQQGVPIVVAMQFEITDQAAISLARTFYAGIARGKPVEVALTETRLALFAEGHKLEWGTPVLFTRSPSGVIFDIRNQPPGGRQSNLANIDGPTGDDNYAPVPVAQGETPVSTPSVPQPTTEQVHVSGSTVEAPEAKSEPVLREQITTQVQVSVAPKNQPAQRDATQGTSSRFVFLSTWFVICMLGWFMTFYLAVYCTLKGNESIYKQGSLIEQLMAQLPLCLAVGLFAGVLTWVPLYGHLQARMQWPRLTTLLDGTLSKTKVTAIITMVQWPLLTAVGVAVSSLAYIVWFVWFRPGGIYFLLPFIILPSFCSAFQWFALRRVLSNAAWWFVVAGVGGAFANLLAFNLRGLLNNLSIDTPSGAELPAGAVFYALATTWYFAANLKHEHR